MNDRKLFGTNELVDEFVKSLTKIESLDGGWTVKYIDIKTGQNWLRYVVDLDRGYFYNLIATNPRPTTSELIDIAFGSPFDDEVAAASSRLYLDEEEFHEEFRQQLIERLSLLSTQIIKNEEYKRIKTIIEAAQLSDKVNKRNIIGKYLSEIQKDAEFFESCARAAENILNKLNRKS
jgi:hypothetical protein